MLVGGASRDGEIKSRGWQRYSQQAGILEKVEGDACATLIVGWSLGERRLGAHRLSL